MVGIYEIKAEELAELTTQAAKASSAAAFGDRGREREAWNKFDAIIKSVMLRPLRDGVEHF